MNVKTLTHSQQQPQGPKAYKKKSTVRLSMFIVPQRSLLYRFLVLIDVKCKTYTQQQNTQLKSHLRAVNLTENDAEHTFKAPCCCYENALTNDLLLFGQSM